MKKLLFLLIGMLCLTGCGAVETWETIDDLNAVPVMAEPAIIGLSIPNEAEVTALELDDGKMYLFEDYSVILQTLEGGDIGRTVQTVTGFEKEKIDLIKTNINGIISYRCAWCAAGESEDQICRAIILDDGTHHYAVTVMAAYNMAGMLSDVWKPLLESVTLSTG